MAAQRPPKLISYQIFTSWKLTPSSSLHPPTKNTQRCLFLLESTSCLKCSCYSLCLGWQETQAKFAGHCRKWVDPYDINIYVIVLPLVLFICSIYSFPVPCLLVFFYFIIGILISHFKYLYPPILTRVRTTVQCFRSQDIKYWHPASHCSGYNTIDTVPSDLSLNSGLVHHCMWI